MNSPSEGPPVKSSAEKFEGLAFTFCKAATIILIAQKFALPVASGAAAVFYMLAYLNGKHDTRCFMLYPPLIASFWSLVCVVSTCIILNPSLLLSLKGFIAPFVPFIAS